MNTSLRGRTFFGRRSLRIVLALAVMSTTVLVPVLATPATPASAAVATRISQLDGFDGTVSSVTEPDVNGVRYLGGQFSAFNAWGTGPSVVVDSSNADINVTFPRIVGDNVYAVARDGAGGYYIGGNFTMVDGVTRNNAAHINSDGSLDLAWDPAPNGTVLSLVVSGSTVYLGGWFSQVKATTRNYAAAVDATNAALSTWNPAPNNAVLTMAVSGSTVYLGGWFSQVKATARAYAAAVDATTAALLTWNPAPESSVSALLVSGSTVYIGGGFYKVQATTRYFAAAVDATTAALLTWNPNPDGPVAALAVSGSTVYLGGSFTRLNTTTRNYAAAVDATSASLLSWNPAPNSTVRSLVISGSAMYMGGDFSKVQSTDRNYAAAVDATSATLASWKPVPNGSINAIVVDGSRAFLAGNFKSVGGTARSNAAALDSSGALTSWNPGVSSTVNSVFLSGTTVLLCGNFTSVGGQTRNGVAAVTTSGVVQAFNPMPNSGGNFNSIVGYKDINNKLWAYVASSGGGRYQYWDPIQTSKNQVYITYGYGVVKFDTTVNTINTSSGYVAPPSTIANFSNRNYNVSKLLLSGSTLYFGGDFALNSYDAVKSRKNIAAIDLDTNSLVDWRPLANGSVQSMEIVADTVYLGGSFSAIGGTFDPAYQVGNSAIQYDYVSGGTARRYLAAVDKSTAELRAWNPSAGATVTSLESSSGTLYAGGDFSYIGSFPGTTRNSLAAFDVATGSLSSWNPGASGQSSTSSSATKIYSLLLSGSDLIVGGSFSTLNGVARSGYGVLDGATNAIVGGNPTAPANTAVPTISGTVNTGETLTASQGTWSGSPSAFRYEWMKSSLTGGTYAPIADATTNSYVVTDADIGRRISVTVTAANSGGATAAQSATTIIVPVPVPKNAVIPTVGGNAVVDSLLSAQAGVWDYGATSYKYQWKQSATVDGTYLNITGAQAPTFALSINDLGTYVKVAVIANNSVGDSLPVESLPTARVTDLVPVNVTAPEATGIAQTNQILSVSTGVWNNRPTSFAYQWKRSATVDGTYINIAGAEANTYVVTADDVGYFIKGSAAGVNTGGTSAYSLSGPTVKAIDIAPVYAGPPVITGTVQTDQILSVSTGVWNNRPTSFTYQWKRSATVDGAYVNIGGAEANTYVVSVNDLGYFFQAVVTGINTGGTAVASAWSGVTIASVDLVPTSSTIPVVTGTTQTEQVLSVSDGVWANRPTLLTFRWQRSATADGTYVIIAGAETNTYVVSAGDVGYFIKGTVSGSNTGGASLYASSVATSQVIDLKPISSISPAITGVSQTDRTLSVSNGSWNNRPTSFTYQWMRSTSANGSYTDIANAIDATYSISASDVGYFFKARVKGVNSGGEAITAATSEATASTIDIAPTNSVAPTISGVVQSGRTLTASTGTWTNRPTLFTYQWRRSLTNSGFVDIDGANSNTYELDEGDVGYRFKVSVIASNTGGVAAADWSTMTAAVLDVAPVVVSAPSVSGTGQVGQRLTASTGSWRSSPTSYTYQWKRASTANGNYASIGSETSNTYDITVDDVGQYIKVAVIATNDIGSSVASLSAARGPLIDIIAANVSAPIASGILRNGEELSASTGQWNSSPGSYTYQWKRSSSATGSFTNISGATNATFALTDDDIDQFIKVAVVAVNSGGSSSAELSATVGPVADLPTVPAPTVSQLSIKSLSAGFTFQVSNYSSTYTYALTASSGSAAMNDTGLVTVKGLDAGSSASITVRSSRTGYRSASLVVQGETTAPPATTTTTVQAATTTAPTNAGPNTTTTSTTTTTTIAPRLTSAVSVAPAKTSTSKTAPSTTIAVVSGLTQGQTQSAGKGATTQSTMTTQPGVTTTTVPAPVVEQVQPGAGVATINGEVVEVELTRVDNQVVVTSGGLSAAVGVLNPDGSVAPLDDKGNVRVKPGQLFSTELGGFVAGTRVEVWMYSTPHLLGSMITDANGKVRATFELPAGLESGDHRLAFVGTGPDGKESTIVIGVVAGAVPKKVSSMKILIAIPILLAILIGLMLPGVLRRRRTEG